MTVSRIRKKKINQFTQISNNFLEDDRISFKSKGIFIYLWSKPDKWKIVIKDISNHGKENESAIRSAFHELREYGYMNWEAVQSGWDYFISDEAKIDNIKPKAPKINKNELIETQFEEFWREYKNIHTSKGGKTEALKKFTIALKKDNFQNILLGTKNYIAECKKTETYTKAVSSFLNQEVWKDWLLNNSQSSTEQRTAVLLNNLMKDSLIDKIIVSRLNKAKLYTTKEKFDKMQNLDQKLREEIKQILNKELGTNGIEFNY